MRRHFMTLAAFLVQPHPPALAVGVVILDPHGDDRANAGEGPGLDDDDLLARRASRQRCGFVQRR
jgi:hypothetical protein